MVLRLWTQEHRVKNIDFLYFAGRAAKQNIMAIRASSRIATTIHRRMAHYYVGKAEMAMRGLMPAQIVMAFAGEHHAGISYLRSVPAQTGGLIAPVAD